MVFVKFHNMNRKKKILMSPLNSNSKNFSFYNISKQCYNHSSKMFSFLFFFIFNLCTDVLSILLKMSVLSFFLFFICCVQQCSSFSFFFFFVFFLFLHFHCPVAFCFCFGFHFFFLFFFIINCSFQCPFFFQPYIYLSVFTLTR